MASEGRILVDKQLARLEKKLHKAYAQAEKDMRQKFNEYTKDFNKEDARLKNLLKKGGITQERYNEWRKAEVYHGKWIKAMIQYYVNEQVTANKRAADMINKALPQMYAESHNFGTFQVEKLAEVDTSYLLYNVDTVARLAKDNPKLLPKATLDVPIDKRWNKQKMTTAVTQGILQGESIPKIAGRLQRVTDMNINTAIRNARTMTTGAENLGKLDSFRRAESMGIRLKKMWSATMDGRTRDSHAFLDGVSVGIDEKFPNGLMYPGDPDGDAGEVYNCRCELSMQLDGFERDRASLFDANANHFGYESYEEWKKNHGEFKIADGKWRKIDKKLKAMRVCQARENTVQFLAKIIPSHHSTYLKSINEAKYGYVNRRDEVGFIWGTNRIDIMDNSSGYTIVHENLHKMDSDSLLPYGNTTKRYHPSDIIQIAEGGYTAEEEDLKTLIEKVGWKTLASGEIDDETAENLWKKWSKVARKEYSISKMGFAQISDIVSGKTLDINKGSVRGGGHTKEYWEEDNVRQYREGWVAYNILKDTGEIGALELLSIILPHRAKAMEDAYNRAWKHYLNQT